ncbi:triose-phosphate isomerase [Sporosarcina cascadiensis]|uniref:triose-phosphate isomerase n=1 Tax=Sporosarcina cascadiensis TaxID=2660747 RepID=UPI001E51E10D|nr:triose-phosphate isomerase [Sporosarcina cascadiensis]
MRIRKGDPFFVVNPKSFLFGDKLLKLAHAANKLARQYEVTVLFTGPQTELANIVAECPDLIVTAQHMDSVELGDAMGYVLADSLCYIGVKAVVLNHADNPLTIGEIEKTIVRAKDAGLQTIVCADTVKEAQAIAMLAPDVILAEPTELIGQNQKSDRIYVEATIEKIKEVNPSILVEQGAGIRTEADVAELFRLGADGVGVTSGIVKAADPVDMMEKMIRAAAQYKEVRRGK